MNVASELINIRRKLVRKVAFLTFDQCTLFQRSAPHCVAKAIFIIDSTQQGNQFELILRISQIVRSNNFISLNGF